MALIDQYTLSTNATFRQKIQAAMMVAATQAVGESPSLHPNRTQKRHDFGVALLNDPLNHVERFVQATCANSALTVLSSDSDIQFSVNAAYDDLAGVYLYELSAP